MPFILIAAFLLACINPAFAQLSDPSFKKLLRLIDKPPAEHHPRETIRSKNDVLYCSGTDPAATENNRAAQFMEQGDFNRAATVLEEALLHEPLFLPFRYNIGLCYFHLNELGRAYMHLEKASFISPEFSLSYLQMGYIIELQGKPDRAMERFKKAFEVNNREFRALVAIGDIYFNRKQIAMARKYYQASLRIDRRLPNGLLGLAKIYFVREKYYQATLLLQSIDQSRAYDKALHYYYAECSYKLRDYPVAYREYTALLKYRNDKFFLTHAIALIRHKQELCRRFLDK